MRIYRFFDPFNTCRAGGKIHGRGGTKRETPLDDHPKKKERDEGPTLAELKEKFPFVTCSVLGPEPYLAAFRRLVKDPEVMQKLTEAYQRRQIHTVVLTPVIKEEPSGRLSHVYRDQAGEIHIYFLAPQSIIRKSLGLVDEIKL